MCHHAICWHACSSLTRRELLTAAGATMVGGFLLRTATAAETAELSKPESPGDWPDVCVAYLRPKAKYWLGWPGTSWENQAYQGFLARSRSLIEKFGQELKVRVSFEPEPLWDDAAVNQFIKKVQEQKPKGVIAIPLHMAEWGRVGRIAKAGLPTIIYAWLGTCFTGHIQQLSREPKVYLASTADMELGPVRFGMKMVRTAHDIRRSRVAVIAGSATKDEVLEPFGLQIRRLPRMRFTETLKTIEKTPEVMAIVEEYKKTAKKIVEPSQEDLLNAARCYVAALKILKEEGCNGITMDCLGAVFDRQMPTPPCLAWSRLLDAGIPAICEADINAVMSHTLCCRLLDKPGFQQDPVPETTRNTFIGAHCVAPTRLHGYDKPSEPFILRSHQESDLGVSVQVLWKEGQDVTIMQMVGPGKMILGKGKVLRNLDTPPAGGCRTSVELALDGPADTRDTRGFHQLFIYGDHVRDFQAYGQMYGIATEHI
ncbi:MAG: hypothetical protein ACUVUC_13530 [Thermoguttaceae bacterium]